MKQFKYLLQYSATITVTIIVLMKYLSIVILTIELSHSNLPTGSVMAKCFFKITTTPYFVKIGLIFVSSAFLHFKKHQMFL